MKVGFIGLGRMGAGMAATLLRAGHTVVAYNRDIRKAQALASQGVQVATRVPDACQGDVVITMLADDAAVEQVAFGDTGLIAGLRPGAIHLSMSTISVSLAARLADLHAKVGQRYVAAPVFGRPDAAASGNLFIVAAGPSEAIREASPLFEAMGQQTFAMGERASAANLVKLSGNFLIATVIESLGEAMALIGKAGIDKHKFLEVLTSTLFTAPVYKTYGALIADQKFQPAGFAVPLGFKDIRLTLEAAEELRAPLPFASLLHDRFLRLLAEGGELLDWSALANLSAQDANS